MKKRIVTICLVAALLATCFAGTYAYLQDTDAAKNTMVVGNVTIEQYEWQREKDADGTYKKGTIDGKDSYVLGPFVDNKPLLPIVGDPNGVPSGSDWPTAGWDPIPVRMSQVDSYGGMQVFAGKNAQDKFVTVANTGDFGAYVRTLVAIEVGSGDPELVKTSHHNTWTKASNVIAEINGVNYYVYEFVYAGGKLSDGSWRHENGVLPAKDTTYPSLAQIYLKSKTTNEDINKLDGDGNKIIDVLVLSQAVQADGFADAQTALDTAFGKVTAENAATWLKDVK